MRTIAYGPDGLKPQEFKRSSVFASFECRRRQSLLCDRLANRRQCFSFLDFRHQRTIQTGRVRAWVTRRPRKRETVWAVAFATAREQRTSNVADADIAAFESLRNFRGEPIGEILIVGVWAIRLSAVVCGDASL